MSDVDLSGAGKLEANQPRVSFTEHGEQSTPPAATEPGLADLRGAGDGSAEAAAPSIEVHS